MPTWALSNTEVIALVRGLLPALPAAFSTTTIPTLAQVDAWLDEAENSVRGALNGVRIGVPTAATATDQLGVLTTNFAVGSVKNFIDTAGGGPGNAGQDQIDWFWIQIDDILKRPDWWGARLGIEPAVASHAHSHITDLELETTDYEATFTRGEKF